MEPNERLWRRVAFATTNEGLLEAAYDSPNFLSTVTEPEFIKWAKETAEQHAKGQAG